MCLLKLHKHGHGNGNSIYFTRDNMVCFPKSSHNLVSCTAHFLCIPAIASYIYVHIGVGRRGAPGAGAPPVFTVTS